jgi:PAS domain S-box-containing protein
MADLHLHDSALVDVSFDALVALDPKGKVMTWNAAAETIFGHRRAEAIGRPLVELAAAGDDAARLAAAIDVARAHREATIAFTATSGREIEATLRDAADGLTFVGRDVTELRRAGRFTAAIGQDLRSPLTVIGGGLRYVQKRLATLAPDDTRVAHFLGIVETEVLACEQMLEAIADLAPSRKLERSRIALATLVQEIVAHTARPEHVELTVEVGDQLPLLDVDRALVRRAIGHLLRNAFEACPPTRPGHVTVRAVAGERHLALSVIDDGVGVAPEQRAQLFDPLHTSKPRGTGLGLAVVARVAELHGVPVEVSSTPDGGSTFTLRLPIAARPGGLA